MLAVSALVGIGYALWPEKPTGVQWTTKMIFQQAREKGLIVRKKSLGDGITVFKIFKKGEKFTPELAFFKPEGKFYVNGYIHSTIQQAGDYLFFGRTTGINFH